MPADTIVPDYIIFDELKRERARIQREDSQRPRMEIPRYTPVWPEADDRVPMFDERDEEREERGEVVISMW